MVVPIKLLIIKAFLPGMKEAAIYIAGSEERSICEKLTTAVNPE